MKNGFIKTAAATPKIKVADCRYNAEQIINIMDKASADGVRLLTLPELCITGYTCADLFLQKVLLDGALKALSDIVKASTKYDMITVVGLPVALNNKLYNCGAVVQSGKILGIVPKTHIPNYGEFSELRHFSPAPSKTKQIDILGQTVYFGSNLIFKCKDTEQFTFAIEICEDLWTPCPPSCNLAAAGAAIILNLSASNEVVGKDSYRKMLVASQSGRLVCGYVYADAGEGESTTDMVFAGHNIIAEEGSVLAESKPFDNGYCETEIDVLRIWHERRRRNTFADVPEGYDTVLFSMEPLKTVLTREFPRLPFVPADEKVRAQRCESILMIQAQGLKKRIEHSYAKTVVIGISGGLDSCLALLVAVKAMDLMNRPRTDVIAVTMPCFGTTSHTKNNAMKLCELLGVTLRVVDISNSVRAHFEDIGHDGKKQDVTFENAQARERTQVIMDISNMEGGFVVGTGDLSELALGWATYNGDHMSMYSVNASIPKTLIRYIVADYAAKAENKELAQVLISILETPISPELLLPDENKISQKTEDLVGPYELHDFYLYYLIRWGYSPEKVYEIAKKTFKGIYDEETLKKWLKNFVRRFFMQQFKRSCVPDGPKVGSVSLSPRGDWKMPSDAMATLWMRQAENL